MTTSSQDSNGNNNNNSSSNQNQNQTLAAAQQQLRHAQLTNPQTLAYAYYPQTIITDYNFAANVANISGGVAVQTQNSHNSDLVNLSGLAQAGSLDASMNLGDGGHGLGMGGNSMGEGEQIDK